MGLHSSASTPYLLYRGRFKVEILKVKKMKVKIPTPLYSYTSHQPFVEADGRTLQELSLDLDRRFPGIRFRMIDEQDQIRQHIKFFVNGKQTFDLNQPIEPVDEVAIVQAFSGG